MELHNKNTLLLILSHHVLSNQQPADLLPHKALSTLQCLFPKEIFKAVPPPTLFRRRDTNSQPQNHAPLPRCRIPNHVFFHHATLTAAAQPQGQSATQQAVNLDSGQASLSSASTGSPVTSSPSASQSSNLNVFLYPCLDALLTAKFLVLYSLQETAQGFEQTRFRLHPTQHKDYHI